MKLFHCITCILYLNLNFHKKDGLSYHVTFWNILFSGCFITQRDYFFGATKLVGGKVKWRLGPYVGKKKTRKNFFS